MTTTYAEYRCEFKARMDYSRPEGEQLIRELFLVAVPTSIVDERGHYWLGHADTLTLPIADKADAIAWLEVRGCPNAVGLVEAQTERTAEDDEQF